MNELYCPNCKKPLQVLYDDKHDETYCRKCGLVLRCPPCCDVYQPDVLTEDNDESINI